MWSWTCAVRFNENDNISILDDKTTPFCVVPNSNKYWCADPFLFEKNGQLYLFFEAFDIFKRKGLLGYRTIDKNGFGEIQIIYEDKHHLSFPCIFEDENGIYIIPESSKSDELFRLKCVSFPDKWEKDLLLMEGSFVDTVRYVNDDAEFLITERIDDNHIYDRVDLFTLINSLVIESENNPQKRDLSSARGAGAICDINGRIIRPSQDCSDSYGEKLALNEIVSINEKCLEERVIDRLSFKDIKYQGNIIADGIHTYGKLGSVEVIDLRIPGRFNLRYTLGFVNKIKDKFIR